LARTVVWSLAGIDIEWISVKGLRRKGVLALIIAPFQLAWALTQALIVILRRRPVAVLGMGGFVSGPGGLAAWLTRRPLVIHEQNAAAGLTNRLLARLARVVLQAFPGSFNSSVHAETVGNPVREDIAAVAAPAERYHDRTGPLRMLVLGGSQGALALNRTVPQALAQLSADERPAVRHQCGSLTLETAREAYEAQGVEVELMSFIEDMASAYAWADIVVCRAGALTVAELCAVGLPALFVPYPGAVDDHQTANARPMADAGAAVIIDESMLSAEVLAGQLREWLTNRSELLAKAEKAHGLDKPHALSRITELCLEQAGVAT
jgi:UDP-N-acetylglucosamine--N-acetylmuramyl-(pentapeptide) pyrophosphoryl-undecaprenol N-acetylglucosamine transferase